WANQNGAHTFHLGGGVGAKSDSLFHFKARFSRQRHKFATWRWIVEPEAYRELSVRKHVWNSERGLKAISPSFFPAYRCSAVREARHRYAKHDRPASHQGGNRSASIGESMTGRRPHPGEPS